MQFDPVSPQKFDAVTIGTRFDSSLVIAPPSEQIEEAAKKTGLPWKVSVKRGGGGIDISSYDLGLETELETEIRGAMTVLKALELEDMKATGKLRCQSPHRASESFAAFLARGTDGRPFVYDSGTDTKHWLNDIDWEVLRGNTLPSDAEITPLFSTADFSAGRFLGKEPPLRRWLFTNVLPYGKVGVIVAPGGTGKSNLLLQAGVSVATGFPLLGIWKVGEVGGVLMLLAEDDEEEIHRRVNNITRQLAVAHQYESIDALLKNLIVKSMVAENNLMTEANVSREVQQTKYVQRLIATANLVPNLKLIVIDPASRFRGGDENSAQDTTRFVEAIECVAQATGATVLFAHHTNKGSSQATEPSQNASRGSSALTDGVRWQMNLAVMTKPEAGEYAINPDERHCYLTATITKNNYAPPHPPVVLKRGEGGYLNHVTLTSNKVKQAEDVKSKIVRLVVDESKAGRLYSKTGFEDSFGGTEKTLGIGSNALRALLKDLVATNKLSLQKRKLAPPHKARVTADATQKPDTPMA